MDDNTTPKPQTGIRPYGPGKFNLIVDKCVYTASLDGQAAGSVTENGIWYGRVDADVFNGLLHCVSYAPNLTTEEILFLHKQAGAILAENDQGFVSVTYFESAEELTEKWAEIEKEMEENER